MQDYIPYYAGNIYGLKGTFKRKKLLMPQYKHQCALYESCGESEFKKLINFLPKKNRDFYATKEAIEFALAEQYAQ